MSGVTVSLTENNDTFPGGVHTDNAGNDSVLGLGGADSLDGGNGHDTLDGGNGDDTLLGEQGHDSLVGGNGSDWTSYTNLTSSFSSVTVNLATGRATGSNNDSLAGIENVLGGGGSDSILGDSLNNILDGGSGGSADTLDGANGNDTLIGRGGSDSLVGGNGTDLVSYASVTFAGNAITVNLATNRATRSGGNDSLSGIENVLGGAGNDTILGDSLANLLDGGNGHDTLDGGTGNDTLIGGAGSDSLIAGAGSTNWVSYASAAGPVTIDFGQNRGFAADGNDTFSSGTNNEFQRALGSDYDDLLIAGTLQSRQLFGGAGNDTLTAGDGGLGTEGRLQKLFGGNGSDSLQGGNALNQTLSGDEGNDTLVAGDGFQQQLFGGNGNDSLVAGAGANQGIKGGAGDDTLVASDFASTPFYGDDVDANEAGNDSFWGGTNADEAYGGLGNDTLIGGGGSDFLTGMGGNNETGDGDDSIDGGDGDDQLYGDSGNDTLSGGAGDDWLDFGAGNEVFVRNITRDSGNDTLIGGEGNDTLDLQADWSFLSEAGGFSLYRDNDDTIYAQGWESIVCFAEGTRIVTPNGEDVVENLRAGDMVLAMRNGQAGFEPLRWVGFMDVAVPRNAAMAAKTAPILIKAGAIAPGMPARDLRVSPDHAMEVDGHLIPAKHLMNGESIIQEVWCRRVRYFHLELEAHGLLLSEGTWSESYLDDGNRHAFNNAALTGLFLDFEAGRSKGQYDHQACLPVLRQGLKLDEIHGRLALRAESMAPRERWA